MSRPPRRLAGLGLAAALAILPMVAAAQPVPAPADSFTLFLQGLSDTTDAGFGAATVAFDTLGLDTLAANALARPPILGRRRSAATLFPVLGWHRAQGAIVGAGWRGGGQPTGVLELRGSYATSAKLGRYAFDYRRTLWAPAGPLPRFMAQRAGRIGERRRLDLELRYARENRPFMPEHADADYGGLGGLFSGEGEQSIYEQRGGAAALALWSGDWRLRAGARHATDRALPLATRFSLFGADSVVADNVPATLDAYDEPFGDIAFLRPDWALAGVVSARGGGGDRWRLRAALARSTRLGPDLRLTTQFEGGATAARAPRQRRFELGGALAVPALPYGTGGTDHLLFGRAELEASPDVLKALGLPHPDWLVLQPSAFFDYGSAWDDPAGRDIVFSRPPASGWRGAVGGGLSWKLGIPEPDVTLRLWMAWPVGRDGDDRARAQFNMSAGTRFELLGRL